MFYLTYRRLLMYASAILIVLFASLGPKLIDWEGTFHLPWEMLYVLNFPLGFIVAVVVARLVQLPDVIRIAYEESRGYRTYKVGARTIFGFQSIRVAGKLVWSRTIDPAEQPVIPPHIVRRLGLFGFSINGHYLVFPKRNRLFVRNASGTQTFYIRKGNVLAELNGSELVLHPELLGIKMEYIEA